MPNTQLTCPHCGSTLSFSKEIAEGTPVECLICMQSFAAAHPVGDSSLAVEVPKNRLGSIDTPEPPTHSEPIANALPATAASDDAIVKPEKTLDSVADMDVFESPTLSDQITAVPPEPIVLPVSPKTKRAEVMVAKPHAAPLVSAIADKCMPKAPAASPPNADRTNPRSPSPRHRSDEESSSKNKVVMLTITFGLLFLMTGGIVFTAWKITSLGRPIPAEIKIADNSKNKELAANGNGDEEDYSYSDKDSEKPTPPPPLTAEEEEDLRKEIQNEVKQVLKRKATTKPDGSEADPDPIPALNFAKQPIIGLDQQKINAAIEKGVAYLKRTQQANGTWPGGYVVGYAAIGGLTLLECDTPAKDPAVQKAAAFVRAHATGLRSTYELSLAVLFLDRLGDKRDRPLIQGMALRLLAGQNDGGGWTYVCPPLTSKDMFQLYAFLQSNKRPNLVNPLGGNPKTPAGIMANPTRDPKNLNDPFQELSDLILAKGIDGSASSSKPDPNSGGVIPPVYVEPKNPPAPKPNPDKPAVKPIRPETLPANLRNLPVVKNQGHAKGKVQKQIRGAGDNSNTQFAMLALWAARRHDVPTDQALLASFERFMSSQNFEGGWGYIPGGFGSTGTMTNVGLLGLAMGHGAAPEIINFNPKKPKDMIVKPALQDPTIQKGLTALSRYIGQPSVDPKQTDFRMENLYLLWSIERVAMLYDLKTIGGKDWYGWGAQILVHNQSADGDWRFSQYHGSTAPLNTCFALLFLRRSNLVQDLTNHLRLNTGISASEK
jgi:hypothetical protein